jgi:hypothetical protein
MTISSTSTSARPPRAEPGGVLPFGCKQTQALEVEREPYPYKGRAMRQTAAQCGKLRHVWWDGVGAHCSQVARAFHVELDGARPLAVGCAGLLQVILAGPFRGARSFWRTPDLNGGPSIATGGRLPALPMLSSVARGSRTGFEPATSGCSISTPPRIAGQRDAGKPGSPFAPSIADRR